MRRKYSNSVPNISVIKEPESSPSGLPCHTVRPFFTASSSYKRDRYSNDAHPRQTRLDYEDIVFETRGDAESILSMMKELIERYKVVTVADLYDLADISTDNYMSNKRGWIDLRNAEVVRIRDGYVIKLTKPMVID